MTLVHHRMQHDDAATLQLPTIPRLTWHLILSFIDR